MLICKNLKVSGIKTAGVPNHILKTLDNRCQLRQENILKDQCIMNCFI